MSVISLRTARPQALLVTGVLLLLALLGCNRGLWTPDEPREAEISREMLLSPAVIPTLNGARFIEKPPLYYWVVAGVFRVSGGASVLAARAVSVVAGLATLLAAYLWLVRARDRSTALLAVCMLGSSLQFVLSTHWVLIDPLLMLVMTLAAWAAWELLQARDSLWILALFYLAMLAALWIKGLIGPVLMGAGLFTYLVIDRPAHWRRLRPLLAVLLLLLSVGSLALALYAQGGRDALWEWGYVNHVKRLLSPGNTGHRQPLAYYLWTLPYTLLPWLLPLIGALAPSSWRRSSVETARADVARYGALVAAGMLVVLSLSATKRETYLLPLLPLVFVWLAVRSHDWWLRWSSGAAAAGALWWCQAALLSLWCLAAPLAGIAWTRQITISLGIALLLAVIVVGWLWSSSLRRRHGAAAGAALAAAVTGAALLLALAPSLLNATKDMGPFMRAVGQTLPPGEPVVARNVDETLAAEIPFYTGRALIVQGADRGVAPTWLLVQDNHDGRDVQVASNYQLQLSQSFGSGRTLKLWHLAPGAGASP